MKTIDAAEITETVRTLCMDANYNLNDDIVCALTHAGKTEKLQNGKNILNQIIQNSAIAREERIAMCQDTGMVVAFVEIGQDVKIVGGSLKNAINEGVRRGYHDGYLRKSVVDDPLLRNNTGDNTPAVIHFDITDGEEIKITIAPKGFGSENMSALRMFKPSDGIDAVKQFIVDTVEKAGPNPCPPIVVGVGIGGTMEKAALLAKQALLRSVDSHNGQSHIQELELELFERINRLGIGPAGLGGQTTALAVNIEVYPTHIAGLPVAVNIGCHATRHAERIL
jgi:fumarate hydratase subunit alpha